MRIEIEPSRFSRILLSSNVSEEQLREIRTEFLKNDLLIEDEVLLGKLLQFGIDMYNILTIFERLGISKSNIVRMMEMRQKQKLGQLVDIYSLEVKVDDRHNPDSV